MLGSKSVEQLSVKIALGVLLILEVAAIALSYSFKFDDYITFVVVINSLFIAYFGCRYLANRYRTVKTYEAVLTFSEPHQV